MEGVMLENVSKWFVYGVLGLAHGSKISSAIDFFLYDTVKIFILLTVIIFAISFIRSCFPPEKTRGILSHKKEFIGNMLAALLGVVTPFCSCSAVPLFIGFVEGGVPLGVTFSFLISSPMANEVAIVLLWGLFGWKITAIYIGTGLLVAMVGGFVIGKLRLEKWVEEYVYNMHLGEVHSDQDVQGQARLRKVQYERHPNEGVALRHYCYRPGRLHPRLRAGGLPGALRG